MPNKGKGGRRAKARGVGATAAVPTQSGAVVSVRPMRAPDRTYRTQLTLTSITADLSVTSATVYPLNGVATAADWSAFASLFDQFRVRGVSLRVSFPAMAAARAILPATTNLTAIPRNVFLAFDNDNVGGSPVSYGSVSGYVSKAAIAPDGESTVVFQPLPQHIDVTGESCDWIDTTVPTDLAGCVFLACDSLYVGSVSIATLFSLNVAVTYDVEFKGRR
jgi:hypothetical protein